MSWFKTDDKLPNHRKARALRKTHPDKARDVAPFGIWVLAGAWSDDGFVPLEVIEDWDDDAEALAARLVAAKLWHKTKRDGEPGYVFHDWADQNPARDDNDPSKSGTFGNHMRWHVQRQMIAHDCEHCPTEPDEEAESIGANRGDIAPDSENDRGESLPSRPDPTRPDPDPKTLVATAPSEIDSEFAQFWFHYPRKVAKPKAFAAFKSARKKAMAEEILDGLREHLPSMLASEVRFRPHPTTWLNGERWQDDPPTAEVGRVGQHLALARQLHNEENR